MTTYRTFYDVTNVESEAALLDALTPFSTKPVVVLATATWCGPCKSLKAKLTDRKHLSDSDFEAYDAALTICGQATLALELEDERPDLDTVLVAVGGGRTLYKMKASGPFPAEGREPEELSLCFLSSVHRTGCTDAAKNAGFAASQSRDGCTDQGGGRPQVS